jgi:hypothetical protein
VPTVRGAGKSHAPSKTPTATNAIPGYKNNQRGLYSRKNRRVRQPSRQVRRCGGRLRPSGDKVVGTSATFRFSKVAFTTICRIDTPVEVDYYRNGGILHTVLRKMAKA